MDENFFLTGIVLTGCVDVQGNNGVTYLQTGYYVIVKGNVVVAAGPLFQAVGGGSELQILALTDSNGDFCVRCADRRLLRRKLRLGNTAVNYYVSADADVVIDGFGIAQSNANAAMASVVVIFGSAKDGTPGGIMNAAAAGEGHEVANPGFITGAVEVGAL